MHYINASSLRLLVLPFLIVTNPLHAGDGVPSIARIINIEVGKSSMESLEEEIGKGSVTIGGHSHGGREWELTPSGWDLYADGFYYNDDGKRIIDTIQIDLQSPGRNVPIAKIGKERASLLGVISVGMRREEVVKILKGKIPSFKIAKNVISWTEKGKVTFNSTNHYTISEWKATLTFSGDCLQEIFIEADFD
jgi:hypothetical protein